MLFLLIDFVSAGTNFAAKMQPKLVHWLHLLRRRLVEGLFNADAGAVTVFRIGDFVEC